MISNQKPAKLGSFPQTLSTIFLVDVVTKFVRTSRYKVQKVGKLHLSIVLETCLLSCSFINEVFHLDLPVLSGLAQLALPPLPDDAWLTTFVHTDIPPHRSIHHPCMHNKHIK